MSDTETLTRNVGGEELPHPATYVLDKAHTTVAFVARHMMVSKVRGHFNDFDGKIVVAEDPASSEVDVTIDVASIDTREPQRDTHLKSADFFDVEKFPSITFKSTRIHGGKGEWKVTGDLTIRDVTRPVTLDIEFLGASPDPWGGKRIGFSATTKVDREDFGLTWNAAIEAGGVVVGREVKIEIDAEAVLQA
ncbi:MAG TPA: YceI family protein [Acidimicrobiales bacterium]|nr:YceI family protein [Acidimicrobiales bacterium]